MSERERDRERVNLEKDSKCVQERESVEVMCVWCMWKMSMYRRGCIYNM